MDFIFIFLVFSRIKTEEAMVSIFDFKKNIYRK